MPPVLSPADAQQDLVFSFATVNTDNLSGTAFERSPRHSPLIIDKLAKRITNQLRTPALLFFSEFSIRRCSASLQERINTYKNDVGFTYQEDWHQFASHYDKASWMWNSVLWEPVDLLLTVGGVVAPTGRLHGSKYFAMKMQTRGATPYQLVVIGVHLPKAAQNPIGSKQQQAIQSLMKDIQDIRKNNRVHGQPVPILVIGDFNIKFHTAQVAGKHFPGFRSLFAGVNTSASGCLDNVLVDGTHTLPADGHSTFVDDTCTLFTHKPVRMRLH